MATIATSPVVIAPDYSGICALLPVALSHSDTEGTKRAVIPVNRWGTEHCGAAKP